MFPRIEPREGADAGSVASAGARVGRALVGESNWRVLVVDDNPAIQEDFRKILGASSGSAEVDDLAAQVFGTSAPSRSRSFVVHSAHQGEEASLGRVRVARRDGTPYALAFMDVRMPPGWDGVKTASHVLEEDPEIAVVICTAYSDHGWGDMARAFGETDRVGQLAAGLAHEINTPIQYASDSVHFLRDALADFEQVLVKYRALQRAVIAGAPALEAATEVARAEDKADLPYLVENVPLALERSLEGLNRVAEKDLGELPPVVCHVSDLNQALLHIIVNAAHAVGDVVRGTDRRGRIKVRSRCEDGWITISIEDTGTGIAAQIRDRIFDPFFTTKEVGTGTGQGLAIARSVICERHGGELSFDTELGKGTTFVLRLPVDGRELPPASR